MFHAATLLLSRVQASFIRWMPLQRRVAELLVLVDYRPPQKVAFWDLEAWVDFPISFMMACFIVSRNQS